MATSTLALAGVIFLATSSTSLGQLNKFYYEHWCGNGWEYLSDGKCAKTFPTQFDRAWQCPVATRKSPSPGFEPEGPLYEHNIDTTTLSKYVKLDSFSSGQEVNMCLILTQRVVDEDSSLSLYNKYYCYGNNSVDVPYEPWSSSKIFAMANAAGHLRTNESSCSSNNIFGLDDSTSGKHGKTLFGDLASIVCSYDTTAGYSSNSLSSYFHDLGWRQRLHDLVNSDWLGVPNRDQSLGGNYGEATPSDLGFVVTDSSDSSLQCAAAKDPWPVVYPNSLSALSEVEMLRRIVLFRELPETSRFPGAEWEDMKTILYGAEDGASLLFPGLNSGGMTVDTAVFLQSTDYIKSLLSNRNTDDWRIFSKLGAGYSSSRYRGEIVSNAYACIPSSAKGVSDVEVSITVRGSVPQDSSLKQVEQLVLQAMNGAMNMLQSVSL